MCVPIPISIQATYMPLNYYRAEGKQISSIFMHLYFNAKTAGACHYFFRFCIRSQRLLNTKGMIIISFHT